MRKDPTEKKIYEPMFPELTAYWARHSWANIASSIDIPDRVIAEALGHAFGNRITNTYIRFDIRKVDVANRKVLDWVLYGKIDGKETVRPGSPEVFGLNLETTKALGLYVPPSHSDADVKKRVRKKKSSSSQNFNPIELPTITSAVTLSV